MSREYTLFIAYPHSQAIGAMIFANNTGGFGTAGAITGTPPNAEKNDRLFMPSIVAY